MSKIYNAIIADDEPLLRRHLQSLLEELWPNLNLVAVASNGEEAWEQIQAHTPDLVFLDIQMPVLNGINLAKRFRDLEQPPFTVFVTAYDQYAVEAFDNEAIDYLLKPIDETRLEKTILRLKERLELRTLQIEDGLEDTESPRLEKLLSLISREPQKGVEKLKWIRASKQNILHMIAVNDIDYFFAESKYTMVATNNSEFLIKTSITALEQQLEPEHFWRIHRNCIVNVNQIDKVETDFVGHTFVYLKNKGTKLAVSRSYKNLFKQM